MTNKNVLPRMVSVSRNCRLTQELNQILSEKLDDAEMETFRRWLKIVEDETTLAVNSCKRKGFRW